MTDTLADIARHIDEERRNLERNVSELSARATAAMDWREQVRRHPGLMVAAALGGGMLLAQLGGRTRYRTEPAWNDHSGGADLPERPDAGPSPFDPIIGAVFAAATSALAKVLLDALSGPLETAPSQSAG
jgi:hypothetical protein